MKRYTITLGAMTTVGGKVISASGNGGINGVPIALEGDSISCPACNSQGKIQCVEPRIPETCNGRKVALENDLCMCGCPTPPRLVANQSLKCQNISVESGASTPTHSRQDGTKNANGASTFDDKFILVDELNYPMTHTEYAIKRENGRLEFGTTDEHGCTHLLTATAQAESIEIYS